MDRMEQIENEFIKNACFRMDESFRMIQKSFGQLAEDDIWKRPNGVSNSIGNLVLHLQGNIGQYAISGLGGLPDTRNRDEEFQASDGPGKAKLLQGLLGTIEEAKSALRKCGARELLQVREVQGFRLSGMGIILHVVEHLSYHTGQIAFWTKLLKEKDLGFYQGIDLNQKNSN